MRYVNKLNTKKLLHTDFYETKRLWLLSLQKKHSDKSHKADCYAQ